MEDYMSTCKKGRRPVDIDLVRLELLITLGVPKTRIAKELHIGRATLYRILSGSKIEVNNG